jgi:hypothetical protein
MRLTKLVLFVCLPAVMLVLSVGLAMGQQLVKAKVLSVDGPVEIRRSQLSGAALTKVNFKLADQLQAGDRITTGWRGRLVLGLTDGSQAVIGERSIVEVKDLGSSPRELFNVLRGKTRVYIEKLGGRPNPYRINTPTAVIAVRGTLFDVIVKSNETEVFVHEGVVAVNGFNELGEVLLSAGQMTRVKRDQSPVAPSSFRPGRNDDSFRRPVATRELADTLDVDDGRVDGRTVDRSLATPRVTRPAGRQDSPTPAAPRTARRP